MIFRQSLWKVSENLNVRWAIRLFRCTFQSVPCATNIPPALSAFLLMAGLDPCRTFLYFAVSPSIFAGHTCVLCSTFVLEKRTVFHCVLEEILRSFEPLCVNVSVKFTIWGLSNMIAVSYPAVVLKMWQNTPKP